MPKDKTALNIRNALRDMGYIWQGHPGKVSAWILAIPSLADYLEKEYGPQNTNNKRSGNGPGPLSTTS